MPNPPRQQRPLPLHVTITGRSVVVDDVLRDNTDRSVRFAMARFGPTVRAVRVAYSQVPAELPMCTIRVELWPAATLIVQHHDGTLELALRGTLREAAAEIARELQDRARERILA